MGKSGPVKTNQPMWTSGADLIIKQYTVRVVYYEPLEDQQICSQYRDFIFGELGLNDQEKFNLDDINGHFFSIFCCLFLCFLCIFINIKCELINIELFPVHWDAIIL